MIEKKQQEDTPGLSPRKNFRSSITELVSNKKEPEKDIEEEKHSALALDLNKVKDSNLRLASDESEMNQDETSLRKELKKRRETDMKANQEARRDQYILNSKEEEYLSNYLKLNYYLEKQNIRHINAHNVEKEVKLVDDVPLEATLIEKIKDLDKQTIPRNTKYFFNGIELSSFDVAKKPKKAQLSLQNISIKQNDLKILGNEKVYKGDFKEMPEMIDSVVKKKLKNKQRIIQQKHLGSTPDGNEMWNGNKGTPIGNGSSNYNNKKTPNGNSRTPYGNNVTSGGPEGNIPLNNKEECVIF